MGSLFHRGPFCRSYSIEYHYDRVLDDSILLGTNRKLSGVFGTQKTLAVTSDFSIVPHAARYSYATTGINSHKQGRVVIRPKRLLLLYDAYRYARQRTDTPQHTVFVQKITGDRWS